MQRTTTVDIINMQYICVRSRGTAASLQELSPLSRNSIILCEALIQVTEITSVMLKIV